MAFRSESSNSTTSGTLFLNIPAGAAVGDVLVAYVVNDAFTAAATFPAGWTLLNGTGSTRINSSADAMTMTAAVRVVDGTEGSSFTVTDGNGVIGGCLCFSGVTTTGMVQSGANSNAANASPWNINATGITLASASDVIWIGGSDVTTNVNPVYTAPSGYTLIHDLNNGFRNIGAAYVVGAASGATGTVTGVGTAAAASSGWGVFLVALPTTSTSTPAYGRYRVAGPVR